MSTFTVIQTLLPYKTAVYITESPIEHEAYLLANDLHECFKLQELFNALPSSSICIASIELEMSLAKFKGYYDRDNDYLLLNPH